MRKQNISKVPNDLEKFKSIQKIAEVITHGDLNEVDLTCPYCGGQLIFSFTRGRPGRFGLFIQCKDCQRRTHFNLGAMPPNFSDNLVMEHFQKMEDEAVEGANQFIAKRKKEARFQQCTARLKPPAQYMEVRFGRVSTSSTTCSTRRIRTRVPARRWRGNRPRMENE